MPFISLTFSYASIPCAVRFVDSIPGTTRRTHSTWVSDSISPILQQEQLVEFAIRRFDGIPNWDGSCLFHRHSGNNQDKISLFHHTERRHPIERHHPIEQRHPIERHHHNESTIALSEPLH